MNTTTVKSAMTALDAAVAHRARIGAELTPKSSPMLVQWYEDALAVEKHTREVLLVALDAEKRSQLTAAYA